MSTQVKDKEAFQRLNFLYQAAHCVLSQNPENVELARFYCYTERSISKRLVLRRDPSIKRTVCKACHTLLIPGVTSTVRLRRTGGRRRTVVRCLTCGLVKRFVNNPKYKLWSEQPEALLENQPKKEVNLAVHQKKPKEKQKAKGNGEPQGSKSIKQQYTKAKGDAEQKPEANQEANRKEEPQGSELMEQGYTKAKGDAEQKPEANQEANRKDDPQGSEPMEQGYTKAKGDAEQKPEANQEANRNVDPQGSEPMEQGYTKAKGDAEQKPEANQAANQNDDPQGSEPMEQGYTGEKNDPEQNKPTEKPDTRVIDPTE